MDEELYKLCSEVYKRFPEWKTGRHIWSMKRPVICKGDDFMDGMSFPLYTSDYLLEKLPNELKRSDDQYGALWGMKNLTQMLDGVWDASYRFEDEMNPPDYKYSCESDTPLKALLKLTIALSEAGELNNE